MKNKRYLFWIPMAVAILCVPLATSALPALPHTFESGQPIIAAEVNANFEHLQNATARLESRGTLCSSSAETGGRITAPGGLVGFPAATALCASACSSPTAHICTTEEVMRNAGNGVEVPPGWYATGLATVADVRPAGSVYISNGVYAIAGVSVFAANDCEGWTSANTSDYGMGWSSMNGPLASKCDSARPILCCD